jgi:hypothetical protein
MIFVSFAVGIFMQKTVLNLVRFSVLAVANGCTGSVVLIILHCANVRRKLATVDGSCLVFWPSVRHRLTIIP